MKTFAYFTKNGKEQLGSDSVFRLDGRNSLSIQIGDAWKRIEQLSRVQSYNGFRIVRCVGIGRNERVIFDSNVA